MITIKLDNFQEVKGLLLDIINNKDSYQLNFLIEISIDIPVDSIDKNILYESKGKKIALINIDDNYLISQENKSCLSNLETNIFKGYNKKEVF